MFPLIYSNNLLAKPRRRTQDFQGVREFDDQHKLPRHDTEYISKSKTQHYSAHDLFLNPQLINHQLMLLKTPEYVGPRTGFLYSMSGWHRPGSNWKESGNYRVNRGGKRKATWDERHVTPRFMMAPRVCPGGPQTRHEGKLQYYPVSLTRILWAIENGSLNPNEVITINALVRSGCLREPVVMWPGIKLVTNGVKGLNRTLHFELQSASKQAIKAVEMAGGSFTATYLTPRGFHQELYPEQYPTFPDQPMPEKHSFDHVHGVPQQRGYLSQWAEEEGKYAHPDSGRRLSHYAQPPQARDFPATAEEYEQVKHHQKWHMGQAGTGTVLPWHFMNTYDMARRTTGKL